LTGILPVGLAMVAIAWFVADRLQLSGWYVAKSVLVFGVGAGMMLWVLPQQHPFACLGPANQVTLVRGTLVALLFALIGESTVSGVPAMVMVAASVVCLLDGADGWLARRSKMVSGFGARFDMETDAVLVAVLAALAWQFGKVGAWVLWAGLLRYLYLAAGAVVPLLRRPLPPSYLRKTIAVVQMVALIVAIAPFVSPALSARVAAAASAALTLSFLQQVLWLYRNSLPSTRTSKC